MLSLWRERWGKAEGSVMTLPYLEGRLNRWSAQLMAANIWSLPGFPVATLLLCMLGLALVVSVQLSLNSQIVFSTVIVGTSFYVRRYVGHWVTLVLVGLSLIASARYFFWRLDATLGHQFDLLFVLGFGLLAAESHIWTLNILNGLADVFPLKRASVPLTDDQERWATVDVFILCHDQSAAAVERAARAAFAMVWPKEKIKIHLLDDKPVDSTHKLASSMGFSYWTSAESNAGKTGSLNQALLATEGEWLVIFDGDQSPDKNFLTNSAGWLDSDKKLGMIQTPFHFLSPTPSEHSLKIIEEPRLCDACAVIRRSMLIQAGGFSPEPVTEKKHTALALQSLGFTCAYIGFVASNGQNSDPYILSIEQKNTSLEDAFRVDRPFSCESLRWRQYLSASQAMLQFYHNVPILIFFLAPLAYLLKNLNIIQTSPDLLVAYGLPHLLQGYWVQARLEGKPRFGILTELKEMAMGFYILMATALAVARAEFNLRIKSGFQKLNEKQQAFDPLLAWPYAAVLMLNLVGCLSGVFQLIFPSGHSHEMADFYLVWAAYNLLLLTGMLAIAEESRHIRQQARIKSRLPAAVRLPSEHAITCVTVNFPQNLLTLELSASADLRAGSALNVSIFRHHREFVFPAHVSHSQQNKLIVNIEESAQAHYKNFGAAVFSRGPDWPKWLPGRNADHPFPPWAVKAFNAVRDALLGMKMRMGGLTWLAGFGRLIQIWKK